jgi:exopolysaccharide biosynthesis operon protein EpsL
MLTLLSTPKRLALLIGAALGLPAAAAPEEGVRLLAGAGLVHDDNLFRRADRQDSDTARSTYLGASFDRRYSLQTISAHAKLSKVKFERFDQLDYDGKDARLHWNWQVGSRWEGNLGARYEQVLAPYTDFLSDQRNLRVQRRHYLDGGWRPHPGWRLRAGSARDSYRYDLPLQRINNRTEDSGEAGIDYLPRSGSSFGLVARRIQGRFQQRRLAGSAVRDDSFDQDELKARVLWLASGSTTVQGQAGYARRKYLALDRPSNSGLNGRVTALHAPAGKLRYTGALWREFTPVESAVVSHSLNRGASLGAGYAASAKLRLDASLSVEKRSYQARLNLNQPQDLDDTLRTGQLALHWTPQRSVSLTGAYARQARSGSPFLGLGSFRANTVSVNASLRF